MDRKKTIQIVSESKCTGCGSCYNKCPMKAIEMSYNEEGFLYPTIKENICIDCGICQKVCPELNFEKIKNRIHPEGKCYAAMAEDDIRLLSSSGGLFTMLALKIYKENGAVCGAVYKEDYQSVYHLVSEDAKDLIYLRGSKYVQSDIGSAYLKIEKILKDNRPVLFAGCPCQVAGLYSYLGKEYQLLYTVDLICHGANSTFAYQSYIAEIAEKRTITEVNFRDKSVFGWSTPVTIHFSDGSVYNAAWNKNTFYEAFLGGVMNRKCCSSCHYAQRNRIGDITLGDFWQVHKWDSSCNDWKGTSLVLLNSEKGQKIYSEIEPQLKLSKEAPLDFACQYNGQLTHPNQMAKGRKYFFKHLLKEGYHKALWYGHCWRFDVGLLGWWFSANYGSVLTYYALGKILEDMDLLPIMIRIPKLDGSKWEESTKDSIVFMQKYFFISKEREFENMQECNQFCDAFLLGSDQLWVHTYNNMLGYTFYLDFADEKKKKIAYATSLGYEEYKGSQEDKEIVKKFLKRFDAISVRESSGVGICKKEFEVAAERMLDPVFLCDRKYYEILSFHSRVHYDFPYILCYILDPTEEKRDAIRKLEKKFDIPSYIILDKKKFNEDKEKWKEENIVSDVQTEEFVYLIKNCQFLFTDSHHGVCFGIIYHKNFAAVSNPRRGKTRFDSLFALLGMEDALLEEGSLLERLETLPEIDYEYIDIILKHEKQKSFKWLEESFAKEMNDKKTEEDLFAKYFNQAKRFEVENKKLLEQLNKNNVE